MLFVALHGEDQQAQCAHILRECGYELQTLDGTQIDGPVTIDEIVALPQELGAGKATAG